MANKLKENIFTNENISNMNTKN